MAYSGTAINGRKINGIAYNGQKLNGIAFNGNIVFQSRKEFVQVEEIATIPTAILTSTTVGGPARYITVTFTPPNATDKSLSFSFSAKGKITTEYDIETGIISVTRIATGSVTITMTSISNPKVSKVIMVQ